MERAIQTNSEVVPYQVLFAGHGCRKFIEIWNMPHRLLIGFKSGKCKRPILCQLCTMGDWLTCSQKSSQLGKHSEHKRVSIISVCITPVKLQKNISHTITESPPVWKRPCKHRLDSKPLIKRVGNVTYLTRQNRLDP